MLGAAFPPARGGNRVCDDSTQITRLGGPTERSTATADAEPHPARELVYTGITRASEWLTVVEGIRWVLDEAVVREVMRVSGVEVN
ncbi:ATP-binding domain-containing protein [Halomonas sp. KO116]|uniref:ATP-binding domain-containing protein n=1 Tax=Halomonas sp. KO116 TaxID=1504981 RepID=UPI0004E38CFE|nr:ATP-binding domain-containing protein [Halomonas sp. KO116]AJY50063.1 hypothetical protein KO116_01578 [Halomonas sp. KO116]